MLALLLGLLTAATPTASAERIETQFVKVGPTPLAAGRSANRTRAVVLIHGLALHPFSKSRAVQPRLRVWQQGDSPLVRRLGADADVYALAYGQNVSVDTIAEDASLLRHLVRLGNEGYREIILVGHSAGGLIARQLVEDHPDLGVTRVIQVCAPNAGSGLAALKTATNAQMAFLLSLTRAARQEVLKKREGRKIPDRVEFVCVVGALRVASDGIVSAKSQWSLDLQSQGVPVHLLRVTHWEAMKHARTAELLQKLVKEPQPRWDAKKVLEMRKSLGP